MSKKYRILIRAFTCRRDVAPMLPLKVMLEKMGCEVIIAGIRNFNTTIRLWKPHAVVINTLGKIDEIRAVYPDTKVVFFDGEGFHGPKENSNAVWWANNLSWYTGLDLVLLWGQRVIDECKEELPQDVDFTKMHVVGNPKLDLVRYLPEKLLKNKERNSVGVVCRYPNINDHQGTPTIRTLPNPGNIESIINQCYSFNATINCIKEILEKTDLNVSIRPHPSEQLESYRQYKKLWFGKNASRVNIDDNLFFPEWAIQQKALISPTSTSFLEAYLLDIPVINTDAIGNNEEYSQNYCEETKQWQGAAFLPKTIDELCKILQQNKIDVPKDESIEKQLDEQCSWHLPGSSCKKAAKLMVEMLGKSNFKPVFHYPKWLLALRDEVSYRRNCKVNPLHPNFNYKEGYHKVSVYLDEMCEKAMAS